MLVGTNPTRFVISSVFISGVESKIHFVKIERDNLLN